MLHASRSRFDKQSASWIPLRLRGAVYLSALLALASPVMNAAPSASQSRTSNTSIASATIQVLAVPDDFLSGLLIASDGNLYTTTINQAVGCLDNDNNNCSSIYKITTSGTIRGLTCRRHRSGHSWRRSHRCAYPRV